jgi:uncharacterized membrane protein YgdD (TMEM256/DUF423 family)
MAGSRLDAYIPAMSLWWFRLAAALCFLGVALGAFGAHGLRVTLEANNMVEAWNKAVLYHLIHSVALVALALHGGATRPASLLLCAGIVFFSGSLYLMALFGARWLWPVTPIGGACFLAGWLWLIIAPPR